jgi:serine/threonine protein kinase
VTVDLEIPLAGTALGGTYVLDERLAARDGDGTLWRGHCLGGPAHVLVRLVPCASTGEALQIVDRATIASGEHHPHVAPLRDCGLVNGALVFLVYDLDAGETLGVFLRRRACSPAETLHIADQLLSALESAHFRDTLHCGIDEDAIFVRQLEDGLSADLLDLGVATTTHRSAYDDICSLAALLVQMTNQPLPQPFGRLIDRAIGPRATGWSSAGELRAALRNALT